MVSLLRARALPLRAKVLVTLAGAGLLLVGASSVIAFRYSEQEAVAAAADQARLTAQSLRAALESALRRGEFEEARSRLRELARDSALTEVRIYDSGGLVLLSSLAAEEGRPTSAWIPPWSELPRAGVLRESDDGRRFISYQPLDTPGRHLLEANFSVASLRQAMQRGARMGILLLLASLLALAAIVWVMFEREVVAPVQRLDKLLAPDAPPAAKQDELARIHASVGRLLEEEKRAEAEARAQEQQLAATAGLVEVGQLAAEMAHEFKRPLAYVHSALDVLRQEYRIEDEERKLIGNIEGQLEKIRETMRDLLSLARPLAPAQERVDLHRVLDEALMQLTGHASATKIRVRREYDAHEHEIVGDHQRLEQAFGNLMLNAIEAMPNGGELEVRTRADGAGKIEVAIRDQGVGMSEEEARTALLPFHSTKPAGTGLGLPLVQRIVSAHQGQLELRSVRGEGTTVIVRLPRGETPSQTGSI
jgi:signal transduction histidine kinase